MKHGAFVDACTHHCTSCSVVGEDSWHGKNVKSTGEIQLTPSEAFTKWYERNKNENILNVNKEVEAAATSLSSTSSSARVLVRRRALDFTLNTSSVAVGTNRVGKGNGNAYATSSKISKNRGSISSRNADERSRHRRLFDEEEAVVNGQGRIFIQAHKYPCKECCLCRP